MKLVYKENGQEVKVGDPCTFNGEPDATVEYFEKPHKHSSGGKVTIKWGIQGSRGEYFVGVIGAEWIERED
jgi:hypothetical protein